MASEDSGVVEPEFVIERKKRCENMTDSQVFTVINVWAEYLPELRKLKRNNCIYVKMVAALKDLGITRKVNDIKNKIQNLTKEYRRERIRIGNADGPSPWKFYQAVHRVIGNDNYPYHKRTCIHEGTQLNPEQFEVLVQDVNVAYAAEPQAVDISETGSRLSLDLDTEFVYSPVESVDIPDDTSSTSSGPRRKKKKHLDHDTSSRTLNKILESMLNEQKKANEYTEKAMSAAETSLLTSEALDLRAVQLLQEHNDLQRQSVEIQRTMLNLLTNLQK